MIKYLLIFLLITGSVNAQQLPGSFLSPNPGARGVTYNGVRALRELYLPQYDTMFTPSWEGAIVYRMDDKTPYIYRGAKWQIVGGFYTDSAAKAANKSYTVPQLRLLYSTTGLSYVSNDNGGGTWIDVGVNNAITDDGALYARTANNHVLRRVLDGFVNVKWLGAVGDGATNNYTAFKNAVTSTPVGGTLFFPAGNWLVGGRLSTLVNNSRKFDGIPIRSDITYLGEAGTNIIADTNNCFLFNTITSVDIDSATQLFKNVHFKNLNISRKNPTFFPESVLINIGSCTHCSIDNVNVKGFAGDAFSLGVQVDTATLGFFRRSYIEDVSITNCEIDGVDTNNRNGITIFTGKKILIQDNKFKRITRPDMPGPIDVEPEYAWSILKDITIDRNYFDGNGGGTGLVSFALNTPLTRRPENFIVTNNTFSNNTNTYSYGVTGDLRTDTLLSANCPKGFTFSGNTHRGSKERMMLIRGVENVTVSDKLMDGFGKTSLIAFGAPVYNFNFIGNQMQNYVVNGTVYDVPISIYGYLYNSSISNNKFTNTGNKSGSTLQNFMTFSFDDNRSKNMIVSNNEFVNTMFDTSASFALMNSQTLNNPKTIQLKNNNFIGIKQALTHVYSWYYQCLSDTFATVSQLQQRFGLSPTFGVVPRYGTLGLVNGIMTDDGATVTVNGDTRFNYSHIGIGRTATNEGGFISLYQDDGTRKLQVGIIGAGSNNFSIYDVVNGNFPFYINGTTQDAVFIGKVNGSPAATAGQFVTKQQMTDSVIKYRIKSDTATNSASTATRGRLQNGLDSLSATLIKTGIVFFSGDGSTTTFDIVLPTTPSWANAETSSAAGANITYRTPITNGIRIFYAVAPPVGTNNISISYQYK